MSRYEYLKTLESYLRLSLSRNEINDILRDYGEYFNEGENQGKSEWEIIAKLGDPKEVAQQIISESHKEDENEPITLFFTRITEALKCVAEAISNFVRTSTGKITVILLALLCVLFWIGAPGKFLAVLLVLFCGFICISALSHTQITDTLKRAAKAVSNFVRTSSGKTTLILLILLCAPLWIGACGAFLSVLLAFFCGVAGLAILCAAVALLGIAAAVTTSLFMSVLPFTVILLLLIFSMGLVAGGILGFSLLMIAFNWGLKMVLNLCRQLKTYLSSKNGDPAINTVLK